MKNLAHRSVAAKQHHATELPLTQKSAPAGKLHTKPHNSLGPGRLRALQLTLTLIIKYLSRPTVNIPLSWFGLISLPLFIYGGIPASPGGIGLAWRNAWDATLHISVHVVILAAFSGACFIVYLRTPPPTTLNNDIVHSNSHGKTITSLNNKHNFGTKLDCATIRQRAWTLVKTPLGLSVCIIIFFIQAASFTSIQQVVRPGWLWNPFLILLRYRVIAPSELAPALQNVCIDYQINEGSSARNPLCLDEDSWNTLSTGVLSSQNKEDVELVLKGLSYLRDQSGGMVISVMGRDVDEHIDALRENVESLVFFVPNLSVVVFENDSTDGSRDHFKQWQRADKKYTVDIMECPDATDCKFGKSTRYDLSKDFFQTSTVGEMHHFRQRVMDYITSSEAYTDYSHILQLDLDIGVSISPLGILHSLGYIQDRSIASSCRQPWPGGLGTLAPPYDFNAFESLQTPDTIRQKSLHQRFCAIMPPGDRWRFVCQAATPMKFLQIVTLDRANNYPYPVESAYNGATLYPLKLLRETNPKYDAGDDGQRCEHVGFHKSMKQPMFVNPKWDMHMSPTHPGGPMGEKAMRFMRHYGSLPAVAIPMAIQNVVPLAIMVLSVMTLSVYYLSWILGFLPSRKPAKEAMA